MSKITDQINFVRTHIGKKILYETIHSSDNFIWDSNNFAMVAGKKFVLVKNFVGEPKEDDMALENVKLPPVKDGGKSIVVFNLCSSQDSFLY